MLTPEPDLMGVLREQWPFVVVVLITTTKVVKRLDCLRESFERDFWTAVECAAARGAQEAQQEAARLRQENEWLKAYLAQEGPGAGYRKAAGPPTPGARSSPPPEKPGRDTRKG